jgi:hypothetical protein
MEVYSQQPKREQKFDKQNMVQRASDVSQEANNNITTPQFVSAEENSRVI